MKTRSLTLSVCVAGCVLAGGALAEPTAQEQLFIYELNRARNDPVRYQLENSGTVTDDLSGVTPRPPLAWNPHLTDSAQFKAQEAASNNYCAHTSPVTQIQPNELARSFGYPLPGFYLDAANNIESIFCMFGFTSATQRIAQVALASLIQDDGVPSLGHRIHLLAMNDFFAANREIGVGVAFASPGGTLQSRVVVHTAQVDETNLFLTGVVYDDKNANGRYDLNEGLSGVTVANSGTVLTGTHGGWAMQVAPGTHAITVSGSGFSGTALAVVSNVSQNAEIDFASGNSQGEVNFAFQTGTANLGLTKTAAPDPAKLNQTLTYTIKVNNTGPAPATDVTLTDILPSTVTFQSAATSQGSCQTNGQTVTCDLGNLTKGATATITLLVTPGETGSVCNVATVLANETDPNPGNNNVTNCTNVLPPLHDLAVTALKAPKKVTLKTGVAPKPGKLSIAIQNVGDQTETINDITALANLVNLQITSLGACAVPVVTLTSPVTFPLALAPKQKLKVSATVAINCANDPLASSKTEDHADYEYSVHLDLTALGGPADVQPANDVCPRAASGVDKGCAKGIAVRTDVIVK